LISRVERLFRKGRRWLGPSKWAIKLLRLGESRGTSATRGLVMVQVDGLSRRQLSLALERGEMPFLFRLLKSERYHLHTHYSGMPSSTPAIQGELFYGIKCSVPAFSFVDRQSEQIIRMYDPSSVARIEAQLQQQGKPLLNGGSAYSDVYSGGASEPHFCPSYLGWGNFLRHANVVSLGLLIVANACSFVRTATLLVMEFFLAMYDCALGLIDGRDLLKELKFVPTRVAICILLRELVTIGAKVDIARGLPVIHVNFLAYDEQAHRRGPSSRFAHWALKGIDDAIARIWRATHRSVRRDYDLWIYSDHGQEETIPYGKEQGRTIEEAVAHVFEHLTDDKSRAGFDDPQGIQLQRARLLGGRKIQKLFPLGPRATGKLKESRITVAAMGPLGHVYSSPRLDGPERDRLARGLVEMAGVPLVLATDGQDQVRAWTAEGTFQLPGESRRVLGHDHPFLNEVTGDLITLCHHPNAGDLVISGWRLNLAPYSFPLEHGSHGGPGPEETNGFALLPRDTPLAEGQRPFLRPADLRHAAFLALARTGVHMPTKPSGKAAREKKLRLMTYNVHSCVGMDGKAAPHRIARVIAQYGPDIVALQELDVGKARTGGVDQAGVIAEDLQMEFHFHPVIRMEKGLYGNAILTRFPMKLVKAQRLPGLPNRPHLEPRGALWASIDVPGGQVQLINTHLGLRGKERRLQVEALLGEGWLAHPDGQESVILCGDFNALPLWPVHVCIGRRLKDAQMALGDHRPMSTWFGRYPAVRIDHVFVGRAIKVFAVNVAKTALARVASDHLPLIVDLRLIESDH